MAGDGDPWTGKKALVVDDYAAIRRTVRDILAGQGLEVAEAGNGLAALDALRREPFDLLVSDLVMPEMDGFELTEAVRAARETRRLPIVIVSTHDDARFIFRALRLGADDYLVKPPTAGMARAVLARVFDHAW